MDGPPCLPAEAAANRVNGCDRDRDHHDERDRRCQHVWVRADERADLVPDAGSGGLRIGEGEQQSMGDDERDRPRREPAV